MSLIYSSSHEKIKEKNLAIDRCMVKLAEGDKIALSELYELIKTDLFSFALSKTKNSELSEDITHDTFVKIYKNAASYIPEGSPFPWIFTIELNLIRRNSTLAGRTVSIEEHIDNLYDDVDLAERFEKSELISELLSSLGEEEREIISLHLLSGVKHREIAALLSLPLSTELSKYHRALDKMRSIVRRLH